MPIAEINGTRIHYEEAHNSAASQDRARQDNGAGEQQPLLLFLHGFGLDGRMWKRQLAALSDRFRVVAYDSRGFGRSAMPDIAVPYRHCEDAAALCEHLLQQSSASGSKASKNAKKVIAIGHSIGAHHLLELVVSRPDLVAGSISICASGLSGIPFPDEIQQTFAGVREAIRAAGADVKAGVDAAKHVWGACGWFASVRGVPGLEEELEAILADYTGWQWTHDNPVKNIDPPLSERLGEVHVPALIITGDKDLPYNTTIGDVLQAKIPNAARLKLPGIGHMASMEAPDAINKAIAELALQVHADSQK